MDYGVQPSPRSESTSNEPVDDTGPIAVRDEGIVVNGDSENQAGKEEEALEQPAKEEDALSEDAVPGDGDGENQAGVDQDADVADHRSNEEEAKIVPNADVIDNGKET
jgi:hypothetical protein